MITKKKEELKEIFSSPFKLQEKNYKKQIFHNSIKPKDEMGHTKFHFFLDANDD